MADLFENVTLIFANHNSTNGTWITHEEVEHFLGDPDVDHAAALVLGTVAILYGRRLPQMLALVASLSFGLWTGLVIQDRQSFDEPLFGTVDLPEGSWLPIVMGVLAGAAAAVLCKVAWKAALVLLTSSLVMLLALAICRLANVSPDRIFSVGASMLSAYRVVGAVVLVVALIGFALAVQKFHTVMISFASAHLGTLLLLSGVSHFAARMGQDAPFSLLDDMARIISEVRGGNCHLWEHDEAGHLEQCDCREQCRAEILGWLCSSEAVLVCRWLKTRYDTRVSEQKRKAAEEERVPFTNEDSVRRASPFSRGWSPKAPSPRVVGASSPSDNAM